jgi:hypothetical protein
MSKISQKEYIQSLVSLIETQLSESVINPMISDFELFEATSDNNEVVERLTQEFSRAMTKKIAEFLAENSTPRKQRAKRDKNAPKKPKTGYMFFCSEQRAQVKEDNPDMTNPDITRELARQWKALADEEKEQYQNQAKGDKQRFLEEMENYTPSEESDEEKTTKKTRKSTKAKKTGPKRPPSAYILFCKDAREQVKQDNPEISAKEILSELGKMWKSLEDSEKLPYQEKSKKLMEEFKSNKSEQTEEEEAPVSDKKSKTAAKKSKKTEEVEEEEEAPVSDKKSKTAAKKSKKTEVEEAPVSAKKTKTAAKKSKKTEEVEEEEEAPVSAKKTKTAAKKSKKTEEVEEEEEAPASAKKTKTAAKKSKKNTEEDDE